MLEKILCLQKFSLLPSCDLMPGWLSEFFGFSGNVRNFYIIEVEILLPLLLAQSIFQPIRCVISSRLTNQVPRKSAKACDGGGRNEI